MRRGQLIRMAAPIGVWVILATGAYAQAVGPDDPIPPSIEYGALYRDVELSSIFPDSKTFPDLVPAASPAAVRADYETSQGTPGFDLASFVNQYFSGPTPPGPTVNPAPSGQHMLDYVRSLWPVLQQSAASVPPYSTLLPLPYPYIVPGGRFREVYYWDSYFTMLGLEEDGQHALAVDMLKDFAYEIDQYHHIPNGNRNYYLSRSQPPFFSLMVDLVARYQGEATYTAYLPELQAEYDYWMQGEDKVRPGRAARHVVRLLDGTLLNRYWDERHAPRDESYKEDVQDRRPVVSPGVRGLSRPACGRGIRLGFQLTLAGRRRDTVHDPDACLAAAGPEQLARSSRGNAVKGLRIERQSDTRGLLRGVRTGPNRGDPAVDVGSDERSVHRLPLATRPGNSDDLRRDAFPPVPAHSVRRTSAGGRPHGGRQAAPAWRFGHDSDQQRPAMGRSKRLGAAAVGRRPWPAKLRL